MFGWLDATALPSPASRVAHLTHDPLFYPAKPPAHWLMVAAVAGVVLVVPLAPSDFDDRTKCRPIGCYVAANHIVTCYREDR